MRRLQLRGESNPRPIPGKNSTILESKQLTEFLQICKMFDCATKLQSKKHTFFQNFRAQELIASMHLMTSTWFLVRVSPNHFSDHNALTVQVDIPLQTSRGKGYWKNNVKCCQNEAFLIDLGIKWKIWKKSKTV